MPAYILQQSKAIVLHSALLFKKWPEQTTEPQTSTIVSFATTINS